MSLLLMSTTDSQLSCGERCGACWSSKASKLALFLCFLCLVSGWCVFAADYSWTARHEPAPYRLSSRHLIPGILITVATSILIITTLVPKADEYDDPFGDRSKRMYCRSMCEVFCCMVCFIVPLMAALLILHATWIDPTNLGTVPPRPSGNDTASASTRDHTRQDDEGLKRGIFSSITGKTKTTPPPPTTSPLPPETWPPFGGPDAVPMLYLTHVVLLCVSLGLALVAKLWKAQERKRAVELGEEL